jgi:hypothetical protein
MLVLVLEELAYRMVQMAQVFFRGVISVLEAGYAR